MANYMFEVTVSNSVRNQTQNVPGKFGTGTGAGFSAAECQAGTLCVRNGLLPSEGYEKLGAEKNLSILNGNSWYFNAATKGIVEGFTGDHTGIYAFNNYDVNKATSQNGELQWNLGANTLGLSLPAGNRGDFTELLVGEQYTWGKDNFTADVASNKYATVGAGGKWTPAAAAPTDGSVYAVILRTKPVNEGTTYWGDGYVLQICRSVAAAAGAAAKETLSLSLEGNKIKLTGNQGTSSEVDLPISKTGTDGLLSSTDRAKISDLSD